LTVVAETERLVLRTWLESDKAAFAALNADPAVMEFFPATLTKEKSDRLADQLAAYLVSDGMTFYAVDEKASGEVIGFVGLVPATGLPFSPAVEIGWRLRRESWGKGYASEAARAALDIGFTSLGLDEIVSFAVVGNARSRAVMERIGMVHDEHADFDHPALPEGHRFRRHVLYRIGRAGWRQGD
jgi:RimJ/RimL family protein N-acetyltransferase